MKECAILCENKPILWGKIIIVQASLRYKGQETVIIFLLKTIRAEN
jgi:hypothetical protein